MDRTLHTCLHGETRADGYWMHDAQGIPLVKACGRCERTKLAGYRPEILTGYDQNDVNEDIEGEGDL